MSEDGNMIYCGVTIGLLCMEIHVLLLIM